MKVPKAERLLAVYSGVITLAFAVAVSSGISIVSQPETIDQITVHRINIVEPDGTLRMVISNHDQLPGIILKGAEQPFARPQAGMLFYNDEGSENGGLIFSGHRDPTGKVVDSGGSLSFDKYGENQIVQLAGVDDQSDKFAGLIISDTNRRIWVGREESGDAAVAIMDGQGKNRILLEVEADGTPSLSFFDAQGQVISRLPAPSK